MSRIPEFIMQLQDFTRVEEDRDGARVISARVDDAGGFVIPCTARYSTRSHHDRSSS
jgi:hypothetical protein